MQRIDFENTTITRQPYVTIDNVDYEVQEGTYQGGTDLDADTFNTLQDNIEEALANVGGNEIAISETEPTTETTKLWINNGEIGTPASEITNSYSTSTGIGYSANYSNEHFGGVELYNNTSGTTENITLSDSAANYSFLEIYYKQQDGTYSYTKVAEPNGKTVVLMGYHITNNGYAIGISSRNVTISANEITTQATNRYMVLNLISNNTLSGGGNTNYIYITKVVGYK